MLKIKEAIIVEGRYDQNTLSQLVDTLILPTQGFGIFKDKDKAAMLRRVAEKRGVIVLTDSDGAGFVIRNHLKGILPPDKVKHAYIPDLYGKERRKRTPRQGGQAGRGGNASGGARSAVSVPQGLPSWGRRRRRNPHAISQSRISMRTASPADRTAVCAGQLCSSGWSFPSI